MHQSSLDKMIAFKEKYLESKKNEPLLILDIGSLDVTGSYREHFDILPWRYYGVDTVSGKNVDIVLKDHYKWREVKSNSVDVLISGQAFEHIEYFWITILEIARVLKHGGLCSIIAPAGGIEHKYPVDCWRFYPDGFTALARFARLDVVEVYTQWTSNSIYTDESNIWQDTILICKKPCNPYWKDRLEQIRRGLLHRMLILGL